MASLYLRKGVYQIAFSRTVNGKPYQKKFSLDTKSKRNALKKKLEFEELYERGEIDPFTGWTPDIHDNRNRTVIHSITLSDLSKEFLKKRAQLSEPTKKNYETILNSFQNQVGSTLPVTFIRESDVRNFCFKPDLRPASQANYLRHLKVFVKWLLKQGYVKKDITSDIKKPVVRKNISDKTITEQDFKNIFAAFDQDMSKKELSGSIKKNFQRRRWFKPAVALAYFGGLRLNEVVSLKWEHINFKRRTITVTDTKSGEERTVPILKELLEYLKAWHKIKKGGTSALVFPSEKTHHVGTKMSKHNVSKVYRKYVKIANVKTTTNFHGLRHTAGTNFMRMGYDINEVAKILGHSSLEVTRMYEHLKSKDLTDKMFRIEGEVDQHEKEKQELRDEIEKLKTELAKQKGD